MPTKKKKNHPLSKQEKKDNQAISSQRVANENVIGMLKRFKIIAGRYRNRRKRFGLRFNLIAAIYNLELISSVSKEVYCYGKTPMETFQESKGLALEKSNESMYIRTMADSQDLTNNLVSLL